MSPGIAVTHCLTQRVQSTRALRKRNATTVYIGGLIIAAFVSIPIVNLATPLFAMSLMVHVHKRLGRRAALVRTPA